MKTDSQEGKTDRKIPFLFKLALYFNNYYIHNEADNFNYQASHVHWAVLMSVFSLHVCII